MEGKFSGSTSGVSRSLLQRLGFDLLLDLVQLLAKLRERFGDGSGFGERAFPDVQASTSIMGFCQRRASAVGRERPHIEDHGLGPELRANLRDGFLGGGGDERKWVAWAIDVGYSGQGMMPAFWISMRDGTSA